MNSLISCNFLSLTAITLLNLLRNILQYIHLIFTVLIDTCILKNNAMFKLNKLHIPHTYVYLYVVGIKFITVSQADEVGQLSKER